MSTPSQPNKRNKGKGRLYVDIDAEAGADPQWPSHDLAVDIPLGKQLTSKLPLANITLHCLVSVEYLPQLLPDSKTYYTENMNCS